MIAPQITLRALRAHAQKPLFSLAFSLCALMLCSDAPVWAEEPVAALSDAVEEADPKAPDEVEGLKARVKALEEMVELMSAVSADAPEAPQAASASASGGGGMGFELDLAFILDVALAWFSEESMQTGAHDPSENGFNLQQLELALGANVDHLFELKACLVFSAFGVEIEEAYGRTLALPGGLQLKVGQFLTQMGRLNPTHPHAWSFVDQPLVNGIFLGSEGSRGLGVEFSWLTPAPWYLELLASATDPAGEANARSFMGGQDLGVSTPADFLYTLGVRQFFDVADDVGLAWGMTAQLGPNSTGNGNRSELYGTDLYLRWRPADSASRMALSWTVEAMMRRRQVPGDLRTDFGGYTQLVWNINPAWEVGARYGFVSGSPGDDLIPEATDDRHRVSAQVTLRPSHFSRIRLQGSWDRPLYMPEPIFAGMLAFEFLIGAHGAHNY